MACDSVFQKHLLVLVYCEALAQFSHRLHIVFLSLFIGTGIRTAPSISSHDDPEHRCRLSKMENEGNRECERCCYALYRFAHADLIDLGIARQVSDTDFRQAGIDFHGRGDSDMRGSWSRYLSLWSYDEYTESIIVT